MGDKIRFNFFCLDLSKNKGHHISNKAVMQEYLRNDKNSKSKLKISMLIAIFKDHILTPFLQNR